MGGVVGSCCSSGCRCRCCCCCCCCCSGCCCGSGGGCGCCRCCCGGCGCGGSCCGCRGHIIRTHFIKSLDHFLNLIGQRLEGRVEANVSQLRSFFKDRVA